jgi:hypothetical protein
MMEDVIIAQLLQLPTRRIGGCAPWKTREFQMHSLQVFLFINFNIYLFPLNINQSRANQH